MCIVGKLKSYLGRYPRYLSHMHIALFTLQFNLQRWDSVATLSRHKCGWYRDSERTYQTRLSHFCRPCRPRQKYITTEQASRSGDLDQAWIIVCQVSGFHLKRSPEYSLRLVRDYRVMWPFRIHFLKSPERKSEGQYSCLSLINNFCILPALGYIRIFITQRS
jgi:hypothetical protein